MVAIAPPKPTAFEQAGSPCLAPLVCSCSGQAGAPVAAAADPASRPWFIALPPGTIGCVILDNFPEVANAAKVLPPSSHGVEHFISTTGLRIVSKFWRLDAGKLQAAKLEFKQMDWDGTFMWTLWVPCQLPPAAAGTCSQL